MPHRSPLPVASAGLSSYIIWRFWKQPIWYMLSGPTMGERQRKLWRPLVSMPSIPVLSPGPKGSTKSQQKIRASSGNISCSMNSRRSSKARFPSCIGETRRGMRSISSSLREAAAPVAIEVKWSIDAFEPHGMRAFRTLHPGTVNLVVSATIDRPFERDMHGLPVTVCPLSALADILSHLGVTKA